MKMRVEWKFNVNEIICLTHPPAAFVLIAVDCVLAPLTPFQLVINWS